MPTLKRTHETAEFSVEVRYTEEQLDELRRKLSQQFAILEQKKERKKDVVAQLGQEVKALEATLIEISQNIGRGFYYDKKECRLFLDLIGQERKWIWEAGEGQPVAFREPMRSEDDQMDLFEE